MKVISSTQSVRFTTGDALSPSDLNDVFLYGKDAVADVAEKRFALAALVLPFLPGLTNADAVGERTHRFVCPVACTVVRAFLDANLTAAAAVTLSIQRADTSAIPTGATTPFLNIAAGATTADDVDDTNIQSVTLEAGVVYDIIVAGTSFTVERLNVVLHVLVDRWRAGGALAVPDFAFDDFTDGNADALVVDGAADDLATEAAKFTARAMGPAIVTRTVFDSATVAADLLCVLPVPVNTRCAARIVRAYLTSVTKTTVGQVVTAVLKNAAGATLATLSNNHATDLQMTVDSGALAVSLNGGVNLLTEDLTVQFSASTVVTVERASLLFWLEW